MVSQSELQAVRQLGGPAAGVAVPPGRRAPGGTMTLSHAESARALPGETVRDLVRKVATRESGDGPAAKNSLDSWVINVAIMIHELLLLLMCIII